MCESCTYVSVYNYEIDLDFKVQSENHLILSHGDNLTSMCM